ncbi:MAG TPA: vitamin B12 dependent-methionine synthase activation domain-containing protein, partial [Rhodothermales bacterium]|nr:vitamin B12 dependent-methionine synthase activation domain-containing protein [Rhodothermales bacterium]
GVVLACNNVEVIDLGVMVPADKILAEAKAHEVDVIGLSGLITPSLDEMAGFARELERQGSKLPLLIGGATTSKVHTAVRIAPNYSGEVVHVLDASRAVPVVQKLAGEDRVAFAAEVRADQEAERERFARRQAQQSLLSWEEAQANRYAFDPETAQIVPPRQLGLTTLPGVPVQELRPFIDWGPFFIAWGMPGKYPRLLDDPARGEEARRLLGDANALLDEIEARRSLSVNAVYGLYPAASVDEAVVFYDAQRCEPVALFPMLRQQAQKTPGKPNRSLADYVAGPEHDDHAGAFVVTVRGAEKLVAEAEARHDDYRALMTKALADRLAEAAAEWLHARVRREAWGYAPDENLRPEEIVAERYRGIRPAPGYPACPDHTLKRTLWALLDVERKTGATLTEHLAMSPAATVCGFYFAHPEADYFDVGHVGRDQVEAYAQRAGMTIEEAERWLSPRLAYTPLASVTL